MIVYIVNMTESKINHKDVMAVHMKNTALSVNNIHVNKAELSNNDSNTSKLKLKLCFKLASF